MEMQKAWHVDGFSVIFFSLFLNPSIQLLSHSVCCYVTFVFTLKGSFFKNGDRLCVLRIGKVGIPVSTLGIIGHSEGKSARIHQSSKKQDCKLLVSDRQVIKDQYWL